MDIELLTPEGVRYWGRRIQFPEEAIEALIGVAQTISADPVLLESFIRYHEATVQRGEWFREWQPLPMDPLVVERMGANSDQFYLLGYLSALPAAWQAYQQRGIDEDIFDATMSDLRIWLLHHYELSGRWTFGGQFAWLWRHLAVEFFRLGRLQFALIPFYGGITGLRRRSDGKIVLLADPTLPLRADGYAFGAGQQSPHGTSWQPVFAEDDSGWRGQVIAPLGFVTSEVSNFPKSEWEICLKKGDTVLDIHIARTDRFTIDDCRDSLRQALDFFARYEPEKTIRAGYCHTWFFTPQLQSLLPPHSNIVRFQREFYLYPFPGSINFLWSFVFGERYPIDQPENAPRDTALRRAVLDWIEAGEEIFDLAGVFFHGPEEWGSQPYMRAWEAEQTAE